MSRTVCRNSYQVQVTSGAFRLDSHADIEPLDPSAPS